MASDPAAARRPANASMSLLVDLTTHAVDEGYAEAARRRQARATQPAPESPRSGRVAAVMVGIVLALAGTLFATSAVATHRGAAAAKHDRKELVAQIEQRRSASDEYERQLDALQDQVASARERALSASGEGSALQAEIRSLELVAGGQPVEGPGVEVTLDDAKSSETADPSLGIIYDRDVQAVVNALFASGAEGIAVNGQRLTTQTAIREAGEAILVDYRPLAPPYRIDAVGPPDLADAFLHTQTGVLYQNWRQVYGLGFTVESRSTLRLPPAANQVVRYAKPLESP